MDIPQNINTNNAELNFGVNFDALNKAISEIDQLFAKPKDEIRELDVRDRISLASNDPVLACFLENYEGVPADTRKSVIFSEDQIEAINRFPKSQIREEVGLRYNLTDEELDLAVAIYAEEYLKITE